MKHWIVSACIGMSLCVAGCGERKPKQAPPAPKQEAPQTGAADTAAAAPAPLADATVTVTSSGPDPVFMVNEALKSAIESANKQAVAAGSVPMDFALQAAQALTSRDKQGKSSPSPIRLLKDPAFAEQVLLLGKGFVTEFSVVSATGPDAMGVYTISIQATITRGALPPAAAQK